MVQSASKLIDDKGGPAAFASVVGKKPGAVRAWKHRNYFPRDAWPEIIKAFPDITLDGLMALESPSPATTGSEAA